MNLLSMGVMLGAQILHKFGVIPLGASLAYLDIALACIQVIRQEHYCRAIPDLFIIFLSCFARLNRQGG